MMLSGVVHVASASAALIAGAIIFISPKGTARHVRVGWIYATSLISSNVIALNIFRVTGSWNYFHLLAVMSLAMVAGGIFQSRWRTGRPNWLWRHYHYMAWSYVGLLAGGCNEACVRIESLKHLTHATGGILPVIGSFVIVVASAALIFAKQNGILSRFSRPA
jgi:uncharacterized membrane protein